MRSRAKKRYHWRTGHDGDLGEFPCLELGEWRLLDEVSVDMGHPCKTQTLINRELKF